MKQANIQITFEEEMLIALIGVCAAAMLLWYVYILMKGDDQA